MKQRILLLMLFAVFVLMNASAQLSGSGYYRIWNSGIRNATTERAFCTVTYNRYQANMSAGTEGQVIEAVPLFFHEDVKNCDPAAVIYVKMNGDNVEDLIAQGVKVSSMIEGSKLELKTVSNGQYELWGTIKGQQQPVYSTKASFYDRGNVDDAGKYKGRKYYKLTSNSGAGDAYRRWETRKVDSNNDTWYLGVKPTLQVGDKYYAPYYVAFPFKPKSEGMRVLYVSDINGVGYTLKELDGIVPANTPVLIECSSNDPSKNRLELYEPGTTGTAASGNKLSGQLFYNGNVGIAIYPDCINEFDAKTMRVWNVQDGELVLSDATTLLSKALVASKDVRTCINANQSYLKLPTGKTYASVLRQGAKEIVNVTVNFYNDGEKVASISGVAGETITNMPAAPTKTGYTFAGWSGIVDGKFPNSNTDVHALWTANNYTISFNTNGGTNVDAITAAYGSAITAPTAPTKVGHTFKGWDKAVPATMPAENVTLTAQWEVNKYVVKFVYDNGEVIQQTEVAYGSPIVQPTKTPTKVGAEFVGWNPQVAETMPANDVTYVAAFSNGTYSIYFNTDGGTTVNTITGVYGSAVTAPAAPTKEGYTFKGWDKQMPQTIPAGDITLTAIWEANNYTITFNVDGGTTVDAITAAYGSAVTAPTAPTKEGYTFLGWDKDIPETMPANDIELTALWQVNYYTISFVTDNGVEYAPIYQPFGTAIEVNFDDLYKAGYTFTGWDKDVPTTMPAADVVLTAKWERTYADISLKLEEGWNWVAFPMYEEDMDALSVMLQNGSWALTDEIKSGSTFAAYSAKQKRWLGSLASEAKLSATMYKLKSSKAQTFVVKNAKEVIPSEVSVSVSNGWNYITFFPSQPMEVIHALDGYAATEGDVIKSATASAVFNGELWEGDLQVFTPGKGYMLNRQGTEAVSFSFPDDYQNLDMPTAQSQARYASNMTVVAEMQGIETEEGDLLVANVNGEERGNAAINSDGKTVLTVQGDKTAEVTLTLMRDGVAVAKAKTTLRYEDDAIIGSPAEPTAIHFVGDEETAGEASIESIIAIYTLSGMKMNTTSLNALPTGIYIVYVKQGTSTNVIKIERK